MDTYYFPYVRKTIDSHENRTCYPYGGFVKKEKKNKKTIKRTLSTGSVTKLNRHKMRFRRNIIIRSKHVFMLLNVQPRDEQ